uniref:TRAP transporter large permease n=1 Tax=Ignisphaera aggregans TaxID=334771 RepID=A0A7C2ZL73_9CREN
MLEALSSLITTLPQWAVALAYLVILVGLIIAGIPVSISIGLTSVLFIVLYNVKLSTITTAICQAYDAWPMLGIFLFTFMGVVFEKSGLTELIVNALQPTVGRLRGGLGIVAILGCAFYGLLTGSVAATAAAYTRLLGNEMVKRGYDRNYTAGLIAAAAPLGAFIPPSIPAIVIGIAIGGSILTMFLVGAALGLVIIPGLILINTIISMRKGYGGVERVYTRREIVVNIIKACPPFIVTIGILASIYLGLMSVTEAGAMGAVLSLVVAAAYRRINRRNIIEIFVEAVKSTSVVMFLITMSFVLQYTWSLAGINEAFKLFLMSTARTYGAHIALTIMALILFVLGMFFDVIVLAIAWGAYISAALAPFGINIYHVGALFLLGVLIGTATPPVGSGVFVVADTMKIGLEDIFRGIKWFLPFYLILYVAAVYIPDLSLWLPRMLGMSGV